jgi:serine/threonine protein phosphatase 1
LQTFVRNMPNRVIAIGDIHGCSRALRKLIEVLRLAPTDTLVTLGDYVNRGPDSRGVLDELIELRNQCNLVPLLGNHDQMLLTNRESRIEMSGQSVNEFEQGLERFLPKHFDFLTSCKMYYETEAHFFVHANYDANKPLANQEIYTMLWESLDPANLKPHCSGKTAVVGHTPQRSGEILDRGFLIGLDTYCHGSGWLTAYEVRTGQTWQVDKQGAEREKS